MANDPDPTEAEPLPPRADDPDDGWPGPPLDTGATGKPDAPDEPRPAASRESWGQPTVLHGSSPGRRVADDGAVKETERHASSPSPDRGQGPIPDERTTSHGADDGPGEGHDSLEFRPGDRIDHGKYEIISRLGGGGFGEVWKARHVTTRGDRAIKVISPRLVQDDPTLLARFRREAEVLEKIRDPHIVEIKDFIEIQGVPCIIMEFIDGQTLRDLLNEQGGPLELPRAARLLKQFCEVLQHAHDHGVVHRDLKPENLMLEAGREPGKDYLKVLDFGIAKVRFERLGDAVVDSNTITQAGAEPPLTPAYGSPEQVQNQPIDHRSDIYSLGVILFEMLTGNRPFQGNLNALLHAHAFEKPPAFTAINPSTTCPRTIESVVRRCLNKDPADRYQQARDVWAAFKAALPAEIKVDTTQIVSRVPQPPGEFQLRPGDRIDHDKYEVIAKIGGGGFGDVWKVRHLGTKGLRAIKIFSPKRTKDDPTFLTRFRREAEVMEKLKDHRIVQIYDYVTVQDVPCIVMEFVEGDTLRDRLKHREGPLGLREIALILHPLCRVLQRAHEQGIVHRDLKPENLMLQPGHEPGEEVLKVLDFGIAKVHSEGQEGSSLDNTLTAAGEGPPLTPAYSSPEQARGGELDHRSDLYTVGVILFELITGQRPFEGNQTSLLVAHSHQDPPAFSRVNPRVRCPKSLEKVVRRCLAKDPDDRYRDANELWTEFRAALPKEDRPATEPTGTAPPPPPPTKIPWRAIAATAGTLCMVAAAIAIYLNWPDTQEAPPPPPFESRFVQALEKDGFRPDEGSEEAPGGGGWPDRIAKQINPDDRFIFVGADAYLGEGYYLPQDYEPIEGVGTAEDGWPNAIRRKGSHPEVVLRRVPKPKQGFFLMGFDHNKYPGEYNHAPEHQERLTDGFYMQDSEVTNGEILAAALEPGSKLGEASIARWLEGVDSQAKLLQPPDWIALDPRNWRRQLGRPDALPAEIRDAPAVNWSWNEARKYATMKHGDLPREAQWEYAARSCTNGRDYPWGIAPDKKGNVDTAAQPDFSLRVRQPRFGDRTDQLIWDLAGNVEEWCRDVYAPYPDPRFPAKKAPGEAQPEGHAIRGTNYNLPADTAPVYRRKAEDRDRSEARGFRIVVEGRLFQLIADQ